MKRIAWFVVGMIAGAAGTVSGRRRVRRRLGGAAPVVAARQSVAGVRNRIDEAVREGRWAMLDRENDLRSRVEGRSRGRPSSIRTRHPR